MQPEVITALSSVLAGTVSGGIISYITGVSLKNKEWKLALIRERLHEREKLFAEFLVITQHLLIQSMEHKIEKPSELTVMNNEFARIEMVASKSTVEAAKLICDYVLTSHSSQELQNKNRDFYTLKQTFIHAARKEFKSLEKL